MMRLGFPLEAPSKFNLIKPHGGGVKWLGEEVEGMIARSVPSTNMDGVIYNMFIMATS